VVAQQPRQAREVAPEPRELKQPQEQALLPGCSALRRLPAAEQPATSSHRSSAQESAGLVPALFCIHQEQALRKELWLPQKKRT